MPRADTSDENMTMPLPTRKRSAAAVRWLTAHGISLFGSRVLVVRGRTSQSGVWFAAHYLHAGVGLLGYNQGPYVLKEPQQTIHVGFPIQGSYIEQGFAGFFKCDGGQYQLRIISQMVCFTAFFAICTGINQ